METNTNKKQLPKIRQTKTSIYRMIKANPLLSRSDLETQTQSKKIVTEKPKGLATLASSKKQDIAVKTSSLTRSRSVRAAKNAEKPTAACRINSVRDPQPKRELQKPIIAEDKPKVTFKTSTPKAEVTPRFGRYRATPFKVSRDETEAGDLCQHLNEWLLKNDKSPNDFLDLQTFTNSSSGFDVENKENINHDGIYRPDSYLNLMIAAKTQTITPVIENEYDLMKLACAALKDLHKLILEGYPFIQCEAWLEIIHDKYHNMDKEPEYWECRALIEQSRSNITAAVEYYRTAIVHGAEVNSVDRLLEELLQKFSLLNIGSEKNANRDTKRRAKILSDARNIFKSSIIQVAVQERNLKKNEFMPDVLETPLHSKIRN